MNENALSANLSPENLPGSDSTDEPGSAVLGGPQTLARGGPDRSLRGTADPSTLPHRCGRCESRWAGNSTCHCGSCHVTFSGVTTFDRHRRNGQCLNPYSIGLSLLPGRAYHCWGNTEEVGP